MDYRCPLCQGDLSRRKFSRAVVARMEIDCHHCKGRIQLNLHRAETGIIFFHFAAFVILAACAYFLKIQSLALIALGAAMAGVVVLTVFEQLYLRNWPRYSPLAKKTAGDIPHE
jgi:hypothetical protein